jgi:hypothetical protein
MSFSQNLTESYGWQIDNRSEQIISHFSKNIFDLFVKLEMTYQSQPIPCALTIHNLHNFNLENMNGVVLVTKYF